MAIIFGTTLNKYKYLNKQYYLKYLTTIYKKWKEIAEKRNH